MHLYFFVNMSLSTWLESLKVSTESEQIKTCITKSGITSSTQPSAIWMGLREKIAMAT